MRRAHNWLLLAIVGLAWSGPAHCQSHPSDMEIVQALRAGGHVIVIRHGATNEDQADVDPLNTDNIAKQRQLSPKGEDAAKALGAAFKQIGVSVAKTTTSQFNRAYQTAKLAGFDNVEKSPDVTEGGLVVSPRENTRRAQAFRKLASEIPPAGSNVVIVSHKPNILDAFGKDWFEVKEGETTILKPDGSTYKVVARVLIDEWPRIDLSQMISDANKHADEKADPVD
jgi:phosphohistidine phosphatase SixA